MRQLANVAAASGHAAATNIREVIANVCSIAAANDVKDNKVNCTIGPSVLVDQIKDVSSRLNINQNAVFALSPASGNPVWTSALSEYGSTPALDPASGTLYVAGGAGLSAFHA